MWLTHTVQTTVCVALGWDFSDWLVGWLSCSSGLGAYFLTLFFDNRVRLFVLLLICVSINLAFME